MSRWLDITAPRDKTLTDGRKAISHIATYVASAMASYPDQMMQGSLPESLAA